MHCKKVSDYTQSIEYRHTINYSLKITHFYSSVHNIRLFQSYDIFVLFQKIQGTDKVEFENESMPSVKVTWKNDPKPLEQIIQIFTIVDVELSYLKSSGQRLLNKIQVTLLKPVS